MIRGGKAVGVGRTELDASFTVFPAAAGLVDLAFEADFFFVLCLSSKSFQESRGIGGPSSSEKSTPGLICGTDIRMGVRDSY